MTPWSTTCQAPPSSTIFWSLLKFMSFELVMLPNHLVLYHPLFFLPSIFLDIRVFSKESALHIRWPKYFSFSISPSNEYLGLISFRIGWFDFLAVQGTFKNLLQHYNLKSSSFWHSAFFMVQLSHQYKTVGKVIVLTRRTFVGKVMSLIFISRNKSVFGDDEEVPSDFGDLWGCPDLVFPPRCHNIWISFRIHSFFTIS